MKLKFKGLEALSRFEPLTMYSILSTLVVFGLAAFAVTIMGLFYSLEKNQLISVTVLMLAFGFMVAAANFYLVNFLLRTKIENWLSFVHQVSNGDLRERLPVVSKGLFGEFAYNLNEMVDGVRNMVAHVVDITHKVSDSAESLSASAQQMNASAEEITSTVQQISKGVETQAEKTVETSQVMSQMSAIVQQVAQKSDNVSQVATQATETAVRGGEAVKEAVEKMDQIFDSTQASTTMVQGLGEDSKRIGKVVGIITGIADQTNLLALNAAIEAARAGEAGRGFAVVADEVRKLAEGSANAAKEIGKLIQQIQSETSKAVSSMQEGANQVNVGREVVHRAGLSLEEIIKVVRHVEELAKEINDLAKKQAIGTDQVARAVEDIAAVAEQTAAGTQEASASTQEQTASMEEMAAAAQELADMSENMKQIVTRFQL